ncbi:hypothetical protein [Chromobacterium subtsugae]|uniref:hypothetical protein n=1 Tax=Chromobacterium subtsugae TaxID=251747 RepID=UPI0007F8D45A|nr:hypothetical protein [Chromobacterium subtsugae]
MTTETQIPADPEAARWIAEINRYEAKAGPWHERGKRIVKRYKDERESELAKTASRYNVLWSNLQVMLPAVYARCPKPEVERRYKDDDPAGRVASEVLERSLAFTQQLTGFHFIVKNAVRDRFLCGRGVAWVRYVPHLRDASVEGDADVRAAGAQLTDDAPDGDESAGQLAHVPDGTEMVDYEEVMPDYVHWTDFGHTGDARVWEEVTAVWRRVYCTRAELVKRFGEEIGNAVPLTKAATPDGNQTDSATVPQKAIVYEIWDKPTRTAIWVCKDHPQKVLDQRPDPLKLNQFWPCPRPLFATLAGDTCIPTPDYAIYQDQAEELDGLTQRINALVKAVKLVGVYDGSAEGVERMLSEGVENRLVPVKNWPAFAEKGGLAGSVQFLPLEQVAAALMQLYEAREKVKQEMYEITGMSDILRGANDPSETATATRAKGAFASIRLRDMQDEAARFARDLLALMGEVMAAHFGMATLLTISGVELLPQAQKLQLQQMQQQPAMPQGHPQAPQQPGQPPQPAPAPAPQLSPKLLKAMADPSIEEVDALLKNNAARTFRIDIETDSTIGDDEQQEQQQRMAFLDSCSKFLQAAVPAAEQNPTIAPLLGELLMFAVRSFKVGRSLEGAFQATLDRLQQLASQPQPPKPDPEMIKVQGRLQEVQAKGQVEMQLEQMRGQVSIQVEQAKLAALKDLEQFKAQLQAQVDTSAQAAQAQQNAHQNALEAQREMMQQQFDERMEQMRMVLEQQRAEADQNLQIILANLNNAARVEVAEITAQTTLQTAQISAAAAAERADSAEPNGSDE